MTAHQLPLRRHGERGRTLLRTSTAPGRSLAGYLLLPRPKDLVKCVVAPLGFAVGAAAEGGAVHGVGPAIVVWLALELLVYQSRYQWNDVRGFHADQAHPDAASRGRLPGPVERARPHITASLVVMALRLGLTAAIAVAVPHVAGLVLAMTLGVFGAALVYERLRSAATGRTSVVPVPLRPALVGLWVVSGAGYAVRGMTGLALAVDLSGRLDLAIAAAATMWALGIVFVTCRWSLEALCLASMEDRRLVWRVRAEQAREHTVGLVRWLPDEVADADVDDPCEWRPLHGATPVRAPWNVALVVSGAGAATTGALLVGGASPLAAGGVGVLAALAVVLLPAHRVPVAAAGVIALVALHVLLGNPRPVAAALPLAVVVAAQARFCRQCANEVGDTFRRLRPLPRG